MGPRFRMGRRRGLLVGAAVGAAAANHHNNSQQQEVVADQPAAVSNDQQINEIKQLAELKDSGILTQEEFDAKKKQILGI